MTVLEGLKKDMCGKDVANCIKRKRLKKYVSHANRENEKITYTFNYVGSFMIVTMYGANNGIESFTKDARLALVKYIKAKTMMLEEEGRLVEV